MYVEIGFVEIGFEIDFVENYAFEDSGMYCYEIERDFCALNKKTCTFQKIFLKKVDFKRKSGFKMQLFI